MSNPTTIQEAAGKVREIFNKTCEDFKLGHKITEIDLQDDYALVHVNDGEQYIEIQEEEVSEVTIGNRTTIKRITYTIQHEEIVHGTRYYPDGSGEPDTADVVDDETTHDPYRAVQRLLTLNFEVELQNYLEAWGLAECEKEAEEGWEEYCRDMEKNPYDFVGNEKSHGLGYE